MLQAKFHEKNEFGANCSRQPKNVLKYFACRHLVQLTTPSGKPDLKKMAEDVKKYFELSKDLPFALRIHVEFVTFMSKCNVEKV
jgi:hypothetical protein